MMNMLLLYYRNNRVCNNGMMQDLFKYQVSRSYKNIRNYSNYIIANNKKQGELYL